MDRSNQPFRIVEQKRLIDEGLSAPTGTFWDEKYYVSTNNTDLVLFDAGMADHLGIPTTCEYIYHDECQYVFVLRSDADKAREEEAKIQSTIAGQRGSSDEEAERAEDHSDHNEDSEADVTSHDEDAEGDEDEDEVSATDERGSKLA